MESLRSRIFLPPSTPRDAKLIAENEIKELFLSLRFFANFAVNALYKMDKTPSSIIRKCEIGFCLIMSHEVN